MAVCGVCKNKVDRSDDKKMECCMCFNLFHSLCIKMKTEDVEYYKKEKINWKCKSCLKSRNSISSISSSPPIIPLSPSQNNNSKIILSNPLIIQSPLKNQNKFSPSQNCITVCEKIKSNSENNDKLETISNNIILLAKSIDDINNMLLNKINGIEHSFLLTVRDLKIENNSLKSEVHALSTRLDNFEQSNLNCNVDIIGIPFSDNTNSVRDTVLGLFSDNLNTEIKNDNIISCYQKIIKNEAKNSTTNIVCVKLDSVESKNNIIKAKKKLINKSIVLKNNKNEDVNCTIYINHSLTKNKREILKKATKVKKDHNVNFLWVQNGKILMRKDEKSAIINITSIEDLEAYKLNS